MEKYKNLIYILVAAILVGGGVFVYFTFFANPDVPADLFDSQTEKQTTEPKEATKTFTLTEVGGSGVKGDGTANIKNKQSSFGIRLTEAPSLKSGEAYEAYIVIKEGTDPQLITTFKKINTKYEKFLGGGSGASSWYSADKLIVTKRAKDEPVPGTIVAETSLK